MCIGKWHGSVLRCRSEDFFSIKGVLRSRRRAAPEPPVELRGLKYHRDGGGGQFAVWSLFFKRPRRVTIKEVIDLNCC